MFYTHNRRSDLENERKYLKLQTFWKVSYLSGAWNDTAKSVQEQCSIKTGVWKNCGSANRVAWFFINHLFLLSIPCSCTVLSDLKFPSLDEITCEFSTLEKCRVHIVWALIRVGRLDWILVSKVGAPLIRLPDRRRRFMASCGFI